MASGTLNVRLRPLRLAFVVPAGDQSSIREAIEISSFLWGGLYNPIIPHYSRRPKHARECWQRASASEVFSGYLEAFDPDFVVRLGAAKSAKLALGHREEIEAEKILDGVASDGTPAYGIGLYEILGNFLHEECRFLRRDKQTFRLPEVGGDLFLASVFGCLPVNLETRLHEELRDFPEFESCHCERKDFTGFLNPSNWFIRRFINRTIGLGRRSGWDSDYVFLMDANKWEDILLYWNMRALGWRVLPMPMELSKDASTKSFVEVYIENAYWPWRDNPGIYNYATLLKSPAVTEKAMEDFGASLSLKPVPKDGHWKFSQKAWIPRFWNDWDRVNNGADRAEFRIDPKRFSLEASGKYFEFVPPIPEFAREYGGHGTPRCANEIEARIYGDSGLHAEVIPEGGDKLVRAVDPYSFHEMRCSQRGMVFQPHSAHFEKRLAIPESESIFKAWFEERKWEVELSDKGHIAKHLLAQLGGTYGTNLLSEESIIGLLDALAREQWVRKERLHELISRASKSGRHLREDRILEWLIETNIVRLGGEIVCPQCRQRSWYSVKELDYELQCRQCLQSFPLPSNEPKKIRWAYHGFGAFRSPKQTQGGLAVILLLRLFKIGLHDQITPFLSFNANKGGNPVEIDLALFTERMRNGLTEQDLVFAECKTHNEFQLRDIQRMEGFARQFPGATLVFATLNRSLSKKEQGFLTPAVNRGRRLWKEGRPFTPIIIFTGNELFSSFGPRFVWRELGGEFARFANHHGHERELVGLADSTQQLYLQLPARAQSMREKYEKRAQKRKAGLSHVI